MNLVDNFVQQAAIHPEHLALYEDNQQLSYKQLQQRVAQLADVLQKNQFNQQPIALFLQRGIDATVAIYAVLSLGLSYLPLDVQNPLSRLNFIIADAQPQLILGLGNCPPELTEKALWLDITTVNLEQRQSLTVVDCAPQTIAAILYTSGSTGTPKGVALSHSAMAHFYRWAAHTFQLHPQDNIASLAPFHFDLSVFDLFSSLASGASVHFVPAALTLSPSRLVAWLNAQHISCWYTVPSLLSFLAFKGGLETTPLTSLTRLLFAGEVFPTAHLIKLARYLPQVALFNLYGPTETNVCCYWQVDRARLQADTPIPIGIAACDAQLQMADNGELLVACANNFSGYWQNGQLIQRNQSVPYPSGDKVSLNQYGEYCYHGRLDRMLKCSGYRVEPAEIETVFNDMTEVKQCAVVGVNDSSSGQRPAAVLVLENPAQLAAVVKTAKQALPTYMLPSKFKVVAILPYLSNGKLDYLAVTHLFSESYE